MIWSASSDRARKVRQAYLIERIIPAHYPANVAQHFECATTDHGSGETDKAPRKGCLQNEAA